MSEGATYRCGHQKTPENTVKPNRGGRCKICNRAKGRESYKTRWANLSAERKAAISARTSARSRAHRDALRIARPAGLEQAIALFKVKLPGWWFTVGECQVSADASCAPTRESPHIALIPLDQRFDAGFHADLPQPDTMANALRTVLSEALEAIQLAEKHNDAG